MARANARGTLSFVLALLGGASFGLVLVEALPPASSDPWFFGPLHLGPREPPHPEVLADETRPLRAPPVPTTRALAPPPPDATERCLATAAVLPPGHSNDTLSTSVVTGVEIRQDVALGRDTAEHLIAVARVVEPGWRVRDVVNVTRERFETCYIDGHLDVLVLFRTWERRNVTLDGDATFAALALARQGERPRLADILDITREAGAESIRVIAREPLPGSLTARAAPPHPHAPALPAPAWREGGAT